MPLLLATTACSTPQTIPSKILASLAETPPGAAVRILLEEGEPAQWIIPIDFESVPVAVRRAAEAVLQGGELAFVGQVHGGSEAAYFLEKRYPKAHVRKAIIAKDGRIALRSHSIQQADLPGEISATIHGLGTLETLEFIEDDDDSYYRAVFLDKQGWQKAIELGMDGEQRRLLKILTIEASVVQ